MVFSSLFNIILEKDGKETLVYSEGGFKREPWFPFDGKETLVSYYRDVKIFIV